MYLLLRVNSRRRWQDEPSRTFLADDEDAPVDLLTDFRVQDNGLSVYVVDEQQARATQIAVAIAASRQKVQEVDYVLFDARLMDELGFTRKSTSGKVADPEVVGWHQDVTIATVNALARLVVHLWRNFDRK